MDLKEFGSIFPIRTYWERNSLSQGREGRFEWIEGVDLGVQIEVRPAISFIRSSKAQSRLEKALDGNSNLTRRASFFSLNPITTLALEERASRAEWEWERETPSLKRGE